MNVFKSILSLPSLYRNAYPVFRNNLLCQVRNINYTNTVMPPLEEEYTKAEKQPKWLSYNDKIFPPQGPDEEKRPAYVCHMKPNIKYSPEKMWYIACLVRGMSVDEALRQLNHIQKKGAVTVRNAILEAQQLAVEEHYVEYKSNLWVAESFVGKGYVIRGYRRHARMRVGKVEYKYCNYYVRLEEGKPPLNYYNKPARDRNTLLSEWMELMRNRRIVSSL